jgi:hypothetical protein
MPMSLQSTIQFFSTKPRLLFLLDGLGAAATTIALLFVLRPFGHYIGMPIDIVNNLSVLGFVFCVYSIGCYFLLKRNWSPFLSIIACCNLLYCVATITLLYLNYSSLTRLGISYFLVEIVIIGLIVYIEFRVASALKGKR